jgi:type VI secretion system protein ImpL
LSEPLDGLFTYQGYGEVFETEFLGLAKEAAEESWVLGKDATIDLASPEFADVTRQVRELYLTDYANHWWSLVRDIDIVPLASLEDAVRVLRIISGDDSPLLRLLTAVERETALETRGDDQQPSVVSGASDRLNDLRRRFTDLLPGSSEQSLGEPAVQNPVEQQFAKLNALVRAPGEGETLPLERTLSRLYDLYVAMNALVNVPRNERPSRTQEILQDAVTQLKLEGEQLPEPLGKLLGDLASNSIVIASGDVRAELNRQWQSKVLDFYRKALSGRYPLSPDSRREATLEDFGTFFAPGGLVDAFFKENLAAHVDTSRRQWSLNRGAPAISSEALRQFQLAARIRDEFFRAGAGSPSVQFQLKPITMDVAATQFLLELDGQKVTYRHDPPRPESLQWPAPNPTGQVSVRFVPAADFGPSGLTEDGPWAWFRILDQARIETTDLPERYLLRFEVGGRWAQYELRASSAFNPFNRSALEQFRCPERL